MKKILSLLCSFSFLAALAQTPCVGGMAGQFPCDGYDLMSHLDLNNLNASSGNDSWGWTDPMDGKEYAIVGLDNGTAFIDISDPINPVFLGKLPTETTNSTWRDIKVYQNHAFIVADLAGNHGMQVFDLTHLRNVANPPETFTNDAYYNGFGSCHNLAINEATGFAYAIGTNTFSGGPHFVNIQNPTSPVAAGGFSAEGYTHDAQIVIYNGPDPDYTGKEIFFGCNEDTFVIVDVTDKSNPVTIANVAYTNVAYTHQGWLTDDQGYFLLGDELDEINFGFGTKTIVFDVSDLDNPVVDFNYMGTTPATDHNGYVNGDTFYLSNYTAGLRIIDLTNINNQNIVETGYFDTFPENNDAGFSGVWSNYPYFASGNIVISDMNRGFFLVRDSNLATEKTEIPQTFTFFPNPTTGKINLSSKTNPISTIHIYNMLGQRLLDFEFLEKASQSIDVSSLSPGIYSIRVNNDSSQRLIVK